MTNVDQFESMFRSASLEIYQHELVNIESVFMVMDRDDENGGDHRTSTAFSSVTAKSLVGQAGESSLGTG